MITAEPKDAARRRAVAERDTVLRSGRETLRTGSARAIRELPNRLLERLTPEEIKEALATSRERPRTEPSPPRHRPSPSAWRRLQAVPPPLRGVIAAFAVGAAICWLVLAAEPLAASGPHAPAGVADLNLWPSCRRLSPGVDRCLYAVRSGGLTWHEAAADLDLPETTLRADNQHLPPTDPLPARAVLVINRRPLSN